MKKAYYILLGILLISLVAATIPVDNWDFKDYYNLTNVNNLTSNYLSVLNNIISSGNVTAQYFFGNGMGLGTTDPATTLEVSGTGITADGPISTDSILYFTSSDHVRNDWHVTYSTTNTGLDFVESGVAANRLFLHDGGYVGIGTETPATTLDVAGTITVNHTILGNGDNVRIGDAGDDTHALTANDDLFVSGKLEVDGASYFDGIVNFFSTIGTALNLGGNDLQNVTNIDGYEEVINMEDNTTFSGDKDIHYGEVDINNDLNPQADIQQGDTNNLLLFNRTINGTHIIFDSPQGLPFIFNEDLDVTGNFTGNQIYGEMWYHNHTATEVNFAVDGTYYNLSFSNSLVNGMTFNNTGDYMEVDFAGVYKTCYMASGDGQNNHVYFTDITVNGAVIDKCEVHKKMTAGGDVVTMTGCCLLELNKDDQVRLATADIGGTGTGNYYSSNLNLMRIGN